MLPCFWFLSTIAGVDLSIVFIGDGSLLSTDGLTGSVGKFRAGTGDYASLGSFGASLLVAIAGVFFSLFDSFESFLSPASGFGAALQRLS